MMAFQLSLERRTIWTKRFKQLGAAAVLLMVTSPVMAYSWVDHRGYYHQRGLPTPGVYPRHHAQHQQPRPDPRDARDSRPQIERVRVGRHIVMIIPDDTKFVPIDDPKSLVSEGGQSTDGTRSSRRRHSLAAAKQARRHSRSAHAIARQAPPPATPALADTRSNEYQTPFGSVSKLFSGAQ